MRYLTVFGLALAISLVFVFQGETAVAKPAPDGPDRPEPAEQSCEARAKTIRKRSHQLVVLIATQDKAFANIANRVKTYYIDVVVPSGRSVAEYDKLVSEINQKQQDVHSKLGDVTTASGVFTCPADNVKARITAFRAAAQTVRTALQDYRATIKNLIVAIRSATGDTKKK